MGDKRTTVSAVMFDSVLAERDWLRERVIFLTAELIKLVREIKKAKLEKNEKFV
ncbi:MAG: hypothetical protein ACTSXY_12275 [Promethearchaeota archaeon]